MLSSTVRNRVALFSAALALAPATALAATADAQAAAFDAGAQVASAGAAAAAPKLATGGGGGGVVVPTGTTASFRIVPGFGTTASDAMCAQFDSLLQGLLDQLDVVEDTPGHTIDDIGEVLSAIEHVNWAAVTADCSII